MEVEAVILQDVQPRQRILGDERLAKARLRWNQSFHQSFHTPLDQGCLLIDRERNGIGRRLETLERRQAFLTETQIEGRLDLSHRCARLNLQSWNLRIGARCLELGQRLEVGKRLDIRKLVELGQWLHVSRGAGPLTRFGRERPAFDAFHLGSRSGRGSAYVEEDESALLLGLRSVGPARLNAWVE